MADFNRQITGSQAVTDVMKTMGLPAPASVADSQDPVAMQMWALANDVGQELVDAMNWQFLSRDFILNTIIGQTEYDLPADLQSFESDSQWNYTTRLPAVGSLRQYEWQALNARNLAGTTFQMLFRIERDKIVLYETPSTVQEIHFPYTGRGWVFRPATDAYRDTLELNDDICLFDPVLFKRRLKLAWLAEKKFDTTRAQAEFDAALAAAKGTDSTARTLSLGQRGGYPYLGVLNIPDTGYGST